jgi:hypothetical protein
MIDFLSCSKGVVLFHSSLVFCLSNLLSYISLESQDYFLFKELFGLNSHFIHPCIPTIVLSVDSKARLGQLYTFSKETQTLLFAV